MKQTMEISDDAIIFKLKEADIVFRKHQGSLFLVSSKIKKDVKIINDGVDITHIHTQIIKGSNLTSNN